MTPVPLEEGTKCRRRSWKVAVIYSGKNKHKSSGAGKLEFRRCNQELAGG
jgi:hypothetical protein